MNKPQTTNRDRRTQRQLAAVLSQYIKELAGQRRLNRWFCATTNGA